jgi:CheY-like chemotaxis protein
MPRTLLLADDSITIQKVVAITFAAEDFTVVAVDNGEDAYARARELRPAIIIADVSMPRRNGYELAHAVKSDPELRNIPVLLLAGTFEPLDPAKATASLANGHLVKPFDSQVLIDKVNELLGGATTGAQVPVALPAAHAPMAPARPAPLPLGAVPQRPVPLTQQPMARPLTSPFGFPAAPAAMAPPPAASRPAPAAPPFQAPRAPLPLTSPFPSAPSAIPAAIPATVPVRPQVAAIPLIPQPISPFSPPLAAPASSHAASPFPSAAAPRPMPSAPAVPAPFLRPAPIPAAPPRASPFPPASAQAPRQAVAPAPSPTTNLWGAAPPTARPTSPMPVAPAPFVAPRAAAPVAAPPAPLPPQTPRMPAPAQPPETRPGAYTPTWGEQSLGSVASPVPASPTAPMPQFASDLTVDLSADVSGMAEAAAAASVQPAAGEISLDVPMDEETPELLPEIDGFELGGSQDLDVSITGGGSPFISGALSDFAQQGGTTPTDGLEFDTGGAADQPLELASPHEFLGGDVRTGEYAAEPFLTPVVTPAAPAFVPAPSAAVASKAAPLDSSGGEAALRQALSQASREVIERVVWEVVPQLAEIILREHVERMELQRNQQ